MPPSSAPTHASCNWLTAWGDAIDSTGDLPYIAPAFRTGGGPYWSGFIIKAPWRTYLNYGDRSLIDEHYNEMVRWLGFVEQHCEEGILKPWPDTERRAWFLGDWAVPEGVDKGGESVLHASNCFLAECLSDMVQMARMTGHPDDAERFAAWRVRLVKDIHRHFYHSETRTYANGTVLDQCYALLQGIPPSNSSPKLGEVPEGRRSVSTLVREQLLADIHGRYRDHIAAGLMGVPIFTEWCIREKETDLMSTILRQPDYPGYLYMINNGATTTWESATSTSSSIPSPSTASLGSRPPSPPPTAPSAWKSTGTASTSPSPKALQPPYSPTPRRNAPSRRETGSLKCKKRQPHETHHPYHPFGRAICGVRQQDGD